MYIFRLFTVPGAYHELLLESKVRRHAILSVIFKYFSQHNDSVRLVSPIEPLLPFDENTPIFTVTELITRCIGGIIGTVGIITGITLIFGTSSRRRR